MKCLEERRTKLVHDLVEKAAEIKQLTGKDELPQHYRERMLYIYFELICTCSVCRFDPECEPHLDEVLNQESIHCS